MSDEAAADSRERNLSKKEKDIGLASLLRSFSLLCGSHDWILMLMVRVYLYLLHQPYISTENDYYHIFIATLIASM
jgi:hypothetical protein